MSERFAPLETTKITRKMAKEEDHVEVVNNQVCRLDEEEQVKLRQKAQPELEDTEHLTKALR